MACTTAAEAASREGIAATSSRDLCEQMSGVCRQMRQAAEEAGARCAEAEETVSRVMLLLVFDGVFQSKVLTCLPVYIGDGILRRPTYKCGFPIYSSSGFPIHKGDDEQLRLLLPSVVVLLVLFSPSTFQHMFVFVDVTNSCQSCQRLCFHAGLSLLP